MKINFLDLKITNNQIIKKNFNYLKKKLLSGSYILEKNVDLFEKKFAQFNNSAYCVGVNSGHDALKISLNALGIQKNDYVIVPGMTFISTYFAITELGGIPMPIDIGNDGLIDIKKLPKKLSTKVKGLIAVNLYGNLCNFKYITNYCKKNNLFLIEDSAQSHGAYYKQYPNKKIWGDVATFSFYPSKNLGSLSDGGAIVTNRLLIFKKLKILRNYGSSIKYYHNVLGYNSRLNMITASFLTKKLRYLNLINNKREKQEKFYRNNLKKIKQLSFLERNPKVKSSHHIFIILLKKRDALIKFLKKKGIETLIHYPVIPIKQKPYSHYKTKIKSLFVSYKFSKQGLSLPIGEHISHKKIRYIVKIIYLFFKLFSK